MKTFGIFRHPEHGVQAVKEGFSWPGFLFGFLWAFSRRLYLHGIALLILALGIRSAAANDGADDAGGYIVLGLTLCTIVGAFGNSWRRHSLERRGFRWVARVKAHSPAAASALAERELPAESDDPTTAEPDRRPRLSERVERWHGGKIALLWGGCAVWFLLLANLIPNRGDFPLLLFYWSFAAGPVTWATWTWLGARQG